jgi:glycosyltransferase involved in cell wall biosynthesis
MSGISKVSTLTACFNKGKYLPEFLNELPQQTYFPQLEIVLDHNEPHSDELDLILKFNRDYPNHIKHHTITPVDPLGISWNRCIRESTGDYLTIWNVDDLRTPYSIELQAQYLDSHPSVDIVSGNFFVVPEFPSHQGKYINLAQYPRGEHFKSMKMGPFFMFRKKLCEKAGYFDEQFRCANDFDLAVRLLHHGPLDVMNQNLGYFLDEGLGASTKPNSLCPVETTVVQLRYGIYDRIDYTYLPKALKYNIYNIRTGDDWIPVSEYIPGYENMLEVQFEKLSARRFFMQFKTEVCQKLRKFLKKK